MKEHITAKNWNINTKGQVTLNDYKPEDYKIFLTNFATVHLILEIKLDVKEATLSL